jgi:hypothetical protein
MSSKKKRAHSQQSSDRSQKSLSRGDRSQKSLSRGDRSQHVTSDIEAHIKLQEVLGVGSFGKVWRG